MQTKGKFYIWLNVASTPHSYWNEPNGEWTFDPYQATFFDTREAADAAAVLANKVCDANGVGEAVVLQATKDLQDTTERLAVFERTSMMNARSEA